MERRAVVIVEDDSIIQLCLKRMLQNHGYDVVGTASRGEEAVDVIKETHPGAVLMDIHLKGDLSGIEVYRQLQSHWQDFPVVLLTAYNRSDFTEKEIPEECYVVKKPYMEADILRLLDRIFEKDIRRHKRNENHPHADA